MTTALVIFAVLVVGGPLAGYLAGAARYRRRLDDADDRADNARDIAAEALERLREQLTADVDAARPHGLSGVDMVKLATYSTELGGAPTLSRLASRLDRRARRGPGRLARLLSRLIPGAASRRHH